MPHPHAVSLIGRKQRRRSNSERKCGKGQLHQISDGRKSGRNANARVASLARIESCGIKRIVVLPVQPIRMTLDIEPELPGVLSAVVCEVVDELETRNKRFVSSIGRCSECYIRSRNCNAAHQRQQRRETTGFFCRIRIGTLNDVRSIEGKPDVTDESGRKDGGPTQESRIGAIVLLTITRRQAGTASRFEPIA